MHHFLHNVVHLGRWTQQHHTRVEHSSALSSAHRCAQVGITKKRVGDSRKGQCIGVKQEHLRPPQVPRFKFVEDLLLLRASAWIIVRGTCSLLVNYDNLVPFFVPVPATWFNTGGGGTLYGCLDTLGRHEYHRGITSCQHNVMLVQWCQNHGRRGLGHPAEFGWQCRCSPGV